MDLRGIAVAVGTIAHNTFREAVRDRILYLLLTFSLVLIAASRLVSLVTVGSEAKIVKDMGLSAITIFGVLTAVFVGVSLVHKEIDRRTIYTLLASPVERWQLVTGKYAGLLLVVAMNVALMAGVLCLVLLLGYGEAPWSLLPAIVLIFVQLALVTAFAILFSSFTNPILSAVGTFVVYVVGALSWSFELLRARLATGFGRAVADALSLVLPNLDRLDVKAEVVHGMALPAGYVLHGIAYGVCYGVLVLLVACVVFERREFV